MKKFAIILLLPFCWACNDDELGFTDNSALQSVAGTWKVISYKDHVADKHINKTQENSWGLDVIITFDDSVTPHSIKGGNTTNTVGGVFEYQAPRSLHIPGLGSTLVAEPEWGRLFTEAIYLGMGPYEINDHQLRIYYNGKKQSVTFKRQ